LFERGPVGVTMGKGVDVGFEILGRGGRGSEGRRKKKTEL